MLITSSVLQVTRLTRYHLCVLIQGAPLAVLDTCNCSTEIQSLLPNIISLSVRLHKQQCPHKIIMALRNSHHVVTRQSLQCHSEMHYSHVCGDDGIDKSNA